MNNKLIILNWIKDGSIIPQKPWHNLAEIPKNMCLLSSLYFIVKHYSNGEWWYSIDRVVNPAFNGFDEVVWKMWKRMAPTYCGNSGVEVIAWTYTDKLPLLGGKKVIFK